MIIEDILECAQPYLEGKVIKDAVIGISLIGIELSNGDIGISYVLRENLPNGCSVFPYVKDIKGSKAADIAQWAITGIEDLQRGIGMAVLTASAMGQDLNFGSDPEGLFGVEITPEDTVGMVGDIKPLAKRLKERTKNVIIFDMGESLKGNNLEIMPMDTQSQLLPKCDIVTISGTAIINGTIDNLLKMCSNAREIIIVGPSTPMFPEAFKGTKVTILAGSRWNHDYKEEIFKGISLACGIKYLNRFMIKKEIRCNSPNII